MGLGCINGAKFLLENFMIGFVNLKNGYWCQVSNDFLR